MKLLATCLCLLPLSAFALEKPEVLSLVSAAANAESNAYVEARGKITDPGTNALPALATLAVATNLTWREHLAARICYERIVRQSDLDELRAKDLRKLPGYESWWEKGMIGPGGRLTKLVVPEFEKTALWYYYIETIWKSTRELAVSPPYNVNNYWPRWCRKALADQPEQFYLTGVVIERLESNPQMVEPATDFYKELRDGKETNAVPVLVQRYDAFFNREATGMELYPGARNETYLNMFLPLLAFADARHVELFAKYIDEHPALASLKEKLDDVKARSAPPAKPEPPFRLGLKVVELK